MITIAKEFTFDAAHSLTSCQPDHKCHRLHGHTYKVEVRLFGMPDAGGFIVDYEDIAKAWEPLHAQLDHRCLNDISGLGGTSSTENLVLWVFERLAIGPIGKWLSAIRISESSSTWAELTAEDYQVELTRIQARIQTTAERKFVRSQLGMDGSNKP
jgi:6-pyruvoyltetrahydropterin/6-carboxytetrahydropterin synthase